MKYHWKYYWIHLLIIAAITLIVAFILLSGDPSYSLPAAICCIFLSLTALASASAIRAINERHDQIENKSSEQKSASVLTDAQHGAIE